MTYSSWTLDKLLTRVQTLNIIKQTGGIGTRYLTQAGQDSINTELSAIEVELDTRQPEGEFRTLWDYPVSVGFEPAHEDD